MSAQPDNPRERLIELAGNEEWDPSHLESRDVAAVAVILLARLGEAFKSNLNVLPTTATSDVYDVTVNEVIWDLLKVIDPQK